MKLFFKKYRELFLFILIGFGVMLFATKSSPLIGFNDWGDANIYFTIGKGMFNGVIPYKELFDQKGPLLYLIYGIGSLFSKTSFLGIYIIESISFGFILYFVKKITSLYLKAPFTIIATIIFPIFFLNSEFFRQGGSPEEFIVLFLLISIYLFLKYFKENEIQHEPKVALYQGLIFACVFLIKFNYILALIPYLGTVTIILISNKEYKNLILNIKNFIFGVLLIFIPFLIYFLVTNSFADFYHAYIHFNMVYGDAKINKANIMRFCQMLGNIKESAVALTILFTYFAFIISKKFIKAPAKIALAISLYITLFTLYFGGRAYGYYQLIITIFIPFSLVWIFSFFDKLKISSFASTCLYTIFVPFSIYCVIYTNSNYYKQDENNDVYGKFAEIINREKDPTLMLYDNLRVAFFTKANIMPNTKYFFYPNIDSKDYKILGETQDDYIRNKEIMFVITAERIDNIEIFSREGYEVINENCDLIESQYAAIENRKYIFYLYKVK
jgi:hypothetical protein